MSQVDYADVQGLVRFGYGYMTSASYVLVRVKNADAAKALAPLCSDHDRGCGKSRHRRLRSTSRSPRLASERSAFRSQSLPVFRMSFVEAWGKKAARDNWVTLEKTRHQIGPGAATDASLMRW